MKVALASQMELQGVGVWNLDCLEYAEPTFHQRTQAMWKALQEPRACNGCIPTSALPFSMA